MKIKKGVLMFIVLFVATSCATQTQEIPVEMQCTADADCVPSKCCHPTEAINKDYAPDCSATLCSQECVPETLDCGQGEIKCIRGECTAVIYDGS